MPKKTPPVAAPASKAKAKAPAYTAIQSEAEADRLILEGLVLRYATLQRRFKLQGPMKFDGVPVVVAPIKSVKDLIPAYIKKIPPGWTLSADGFKYLVTREDAAAIGKRIAARKDELGVYHGQKGPEGLTLFVEFA